MTGPTATAPGAYPEAPVAGPPSEPPQLLRKRKRRHEELKADISINSLLDILTVILMFIIKGYTSSAVQLKPSRDLQVPYSTTADVAEESVAITVTMKNILVDDKPVITIDGGIVDKAELQHDGMLIDPLWEELQQVVAHQKRIALSNPKAAFNGIVTIICDRYVPTPLLLKVMYTAGQAEFSQFRFLLAKIERG